jgi:hypothetical protein
MTLPPERKPTGLGDTPVRIASGNIPDTAAGDLAAIRAGLVSLAAILSPSGSPTFATLTISKADSGGLTDLLINPTAKASGYLQKLQINSVNKAFIDYAGNGYFAGIIGIGTTPLSSLLHIYGNTNPLIDITDTSPAGTHNLAIRCTAVALGPGIQIQGRTSRGTMSSPTAISAGDYTLQYQAYGHDGTNYTNNAVIALGSEGTIAANRVPGIITFWTHPDSTSAIREVMRINSSGNVGIGTTSPVAKTEIYYGGITSGNAPANSGTTPVNPMGRFSNNRSIVLDIGGQYASPFGIWFQVADVTNLGTYYPLFLQPNGGNVGIGTTSPGGLLQVGIPATATGVMRAFSSGVSIDAAYQSAGVYGTSAAPSLYFGGDDNTGIWHPGSDTLAISTNGSEKIRITSTGLIGFSTDNPTNLISLGGTAARTIWMERHITANTAGNNLTLQAGGATTGATDKDGGMLVLSPGVPTGTGKTSVRIKRYLRAVSTGTSDNESYDAVIIPSEVAISDGVAKSLFEIALPSGGIAGGSIEYSIQATDGTDHQALTGYVTFAAINKGGAYTTQITEVAGNQAKAVSAGTITAAWTILNGTNKVTIQVTGDTSLTPTAFVIYYKIHNAGIQTLTQL